MRRTLLLALFLSVSFFSTAQFSWAYPYYTYINFDDTSNLQYLIIDTVSNPNNKWQIGVPQKSVFTSAYSAPKAIVTDTINTYPVNDTSSFILWHEADVGFIDSDGTTCYLTGHYKVNSDSLNDYGKIEFSPDNGLSWVLISDDTTQIEIGGNLYPWPQWHEPIILTGNSNSWEYFSISLDGICSLFNLSFGDTVLFRFTFISDGNPESMDGLMFDDIVLTDYYFFGLDRDKINELLIYPNPVRDFFTIQLDDNENRSFIIYIYDTSGKLVLIKETTAEQTLEIDCRELDKGMYHFRVDERNGEPVGKGKFIKG